MSFDLVIKSDDLGVEIALLQDKKLLELHREKQNNRFNVGDIYLGKVKKVVPGLNAAFINVGYDKDAFLHYLDLGPQFSSLSKFTKRVLDGKQDNSRLATFQMEHDIDKDGKITQVVSGSQNILVQIAKEPISAKGPRLSSEITLAGRYIVLVPFNNKISVSQKIKSDTERDRLRSIIGGIKPQNFGVIIRTVAEHKKVAELEADLNNLLRKWDECIKNLKGSHPPKCVLGEIDKTSVILRDLLNEKFNNIFVNDPAIIEELKTYIRGISPESEKIIKPYTNQVDIFEHFGIHRQIKALFGKQVVLPNGGYLIIEHTEAMHVIDVNSGNRKNHEKSQEQNALEVNLEAATEIGRILKLRDMGGIVAIDFIDMHERENNHKLFDHLKEVMRSDRAKHSILPPSKFGVVEITRQRVRPVTDIDTSEICPVCNGSGKVQATILVMDDIESTLRYLVEEKKAGKLKLTVHPFIAAYITRGMKSRRMKWFFKYKKWIKVISMESHHLLEYRFLDSKGEDLSL